MSGTRFVWSGLEELKRALATLPADLAGEGGRMVEAAANAAAVDVRGEYGRHRVTGDLQSKVSVTIERTGVLGTAAIVKSAARHSHLFEYGTQARHYMTKRGKRHATGKMWGKQPGGFVFVPRMQKARRQLYANLADLLRRAGLQVTGDAG